MKNYSLTMVSPKQLLSTVEESLLGPNPPTPAQRVELIHAIRQSLPSLRNLLSYPVSPLLITRTSQENLSVSIFSSTFCNFFFNFPFSLVHFWTFSLQNHRTELRCILRKSGCQILDQLRWMMKMSRLLVPLSTT